MIERENLRRMDVPNTFMRLESLKSHIFLYYGLCAIFLAIWAVSVAHAPPGNLFGHGFLIMYTAVTLSPFYYMSLVLVPFAIVGIRPPLFCWRYTQRGEWSRFSGSAQSFSPRTAYPFVVSFEYFRHALSAWSIALFLFGLAVLSVVSYRPLAKGLRFADPEGSASRR